jgi:uncharacterized protein
MRKLLAILCLSVCLPAFSFGQSVNDDGINRILVIGDAMAGGMAAGMTRVAPSDGSVEIVSRFNESSAITRPDIYNWAAAIPKMMEGKNFDAVVVLIGLNDRQDIRGASARLTFNTPEWVQAYQANTDALVDALKAQNVKIYWLGEPPMGDAAYDAEMKIITDLQKNRVVPKGALFIDTRPGLSNPDGSYMDFGPDDTGEVKKLRQRDGVTFLKQGNNKFGLLVLNAINSGVMPEAPTVAETPATDNSGPVFGQTDGNGGSVLHNAGDVIASAETVAPIAVDQPSSSAFDGKLFTTGEADAAPLGRFDDFSYVAPAAN